jgi:hypothetical protein
MRRELGDRIVVVPEAATILLAGLVAVGESGFRLG